MFDSASFVNLLRGKKHYWLRRYNTWKHHSINICRKDPNNMSYKLIGVGRKVKVEFVLGINIVSEILMVELPKYHVA